LLRKRHRLCEIGTACVNSFVKERREKQELNYRRAQKLVQDSVVENE
jgi:hypothetical protein